MPWVPSRAALGVRLPFKGPQLSLGSTGHTRNAEGWSVSCFSFLFSIVWPAQSRKVPLLIETVNARLGWVRLEAERKARGCMYLLKGNTT